MSHSAIIVEFFCSAPRMTAKGYTLFASFSVINRIDMLDIEVHFLFSPLDPWNHHGLKCVSLNGGTGMA